MDKYLSIITNFGCHGKCPYCIVRENDIKVPKSIVEDLFDLPKVLDELKPEIVSVSGGGDPLHHYESNLFLKSYYAYLQGVLDARGLSLEMHTSYLHSDFPIEKCKRVVYHILTPDDLIYVKRRGSEIVRVVFVATSDLDSFTIGQIAEYVKYSKNIDELSFRQMVDDHYEPQHYNEELLEQYHGKKWHYIKQNDYNDYYVKGKVYDHFRNISK